MDNYKQLKFFKALDKETGEAVAIKMMCFNGKQSLEKWTDIIREVKLLKSVHHGNVVEYTIFGGYF